MNKSWTIYHIKKKKSLISPPKIKSTKLGELTSSFHLSAQFQTVQIIQSIPPNRHARRFCNERPREKTSGTNSPLRTSAWDGALMDWAGNSSFRTRVTLKTRWRPRLAKEAKIGCAWWWDKVCCHSHPTRPLPPPPPRAWDAERWQHRWQIVEEWVCHV